jgi:hybrid cluster-associated redox disulfide protein
MEEITLTLDMVIKQVVEKYPDTIRVFARHGLGCVTCSLAAFDTIERGARKHKIDPEPLLTDLNLILRDASIIPEVNTGGLKPPTPGTEAATTGKIKKIIAVISGKGGVGKSYVTSELAIGLNRLGYRVGILDADITGPSIPRTFGTEARPAEGGDGKIIPVMSAQGIKLVSSLYFVKGEDEALIWRGPLISKMIKDFYNDTLWGELDYLLLDLPPGTSDAAITIMQAIPTNGIILVGTPQMLAMSIVRKAIRLAEKMHTPIVGVVENMSYLVLPESGKKLYLFGQSRGAELAEASGGPLLACLPIDPRAAEMIDNGQLEEYHSSETDALAGNFIVESVPRLKTRTLAITG